MDADPEVATPLIARNATRRQGSLVLIWFAGLVAILLLVAVFMWHPFSGHDPERHHKHTHKTDKSLPVVLWHGMGDSCCASYSIGYVADAISEELGVYVHSIATGNGHVADVYSSFFGNVNDQVASVCKEIHSTPELQGGYNAIGFSQGGQFLRAVAERCQGEPGAAKMHTLITMGAQHQGVYNVPHCDTDADDKDAKPSSVCLMIESMITRAAYAPFLREHVVQAQFFKDPFQLEEYLLSNPFLPDINNERPVKNATYAANLASLDRLVLFRFEREYTVVPRGSEWFDFFDGTTLVDMHDTPLYKEDWIGLRTLDEKGRLIRSEVPDARHMQFSMAWFSKHVTQAHLKGTDQSNN